MEKVGRGQQKGRPSHCLSPRYETKLRKTDPLILISNQLRPSAQLIDNKLKTIAELIGRLISPESATDAQVQSWALLRGYQRISRLLYLVMRELVVRADLCQQSLLGGGIERIVDFWHISVSGEKQLN